MTLFIGYCIFSWLVGLSFVSEDKEDIDMTGFEYFVAGVIICLFPILLPFVIGKLLRDKL